MQFFYNILHMEPGANEMRSATTIPKERAKCCIRFNGDNMTEDKRNIGFQYHILHDVTRRKNNLQDKPSSKSQCQEQCQSFETAVKEPYFESRDLCKYRQQNEEEEDD